MTSSATRTSDPVPAGVVVVDKPAGLTSHGVVGRVRRLAGTRKVGHAGTLDPMATGVLVLGVGRGTRLLGHLMLTEKAYDATIRLGCSTTTDDAEGEVVAQSPLAGLTETDIRSALAGFVGELDQVPSAVSAIKVDGKRAYARVRAGEDVQLPPRRVTVHDLTVHEVAGPDVTISVRCSSGTYIRAIARDLGAVLGVGGHLTALRRTVVGPFDLAHARTLEQLESDFVLLSLGETARLAFDCLDVPASLATDVGHGKRVQLPGLAAPAADRTVALIGPDETLLGIHQHRTDGLLVPIAVLGG